MINEISGNDRRSTLEQSGALHGGAFNPALIGGGPRGGEASSPQGSQAVAEARPISEVDKTSFSQDAKKVGEGGSLQAGGVSGALESQVSAMLQNLKEPEAVAQSQAVEGVGQADTTNTVRASREKDPDQTLQGLTMQNLGSASSAGEVSKGSDSKVAENLEGAQAVGATQAGAQVQGAQIARPVAEVGGVNLDNRVAAEGGRSPS